MSHAGKLNYPKEQAIGILVCRVDVSMESEVKERGILREIRFFCCCFDKLVFNF